MRPVNVGVDPIRLPAVTVEARNPAVVDKRPSFLQREAFGGLKYWQVGLAGIGIASILGGVITLIAKRK